MNYEIHTTQVFDKWLSKIKDKSTRYRVEARLSRIASGNLGDTKPICSDLFELRLFFAGGFRLYYTIRKCTVILLLCGGNKSTQSSDIDLAKKMLRQLN